MQKSIFWLIASNALGHVLGGKRAQTGIWAGMYAFPEYDSEEALRAAVPRGVKIRVLNFTNINKDMWFLFNNYMVHGIFF